jgi:hypothetical protein
MENCSSRGKKQSLCSIAHIATLQIQEKVQRSVDWSGNKGCRRGSVKEQKNVAHPSLHKLCQGVWGNGLVVCVVEQASVKERL